MQNGSDTHLALIHAIHDRFQNRPTHDVLVDEAAHLEIAHQFNLRVTTVIIAVYEYLELRNLKKGDRE